MGWAAKATDLLYAQARPFCYHTARLSCCPPNIHRPNSVPNVGLDYKIPLRLVKGQASVRLNRLVRMTVSRAQH